MSCVDPKASPVRFGIPDPEETLFEVVERALANEMFVLHNGQQVILCSVIPVGWKKFGVNSNNPLRHTQKCMQNANSDRISALPPSFLYGKSRSW